MNVSFRALVLATTALGLSACSSNDPVSPGAVIASGGATAEAKGKPPSTIPVIAEFRCPGPNCTGGDRITGGAGTYPALIDSGGNFRLDLATLPSGTAVIDYSDCIQPCPAGRRWFQTQTVTSATGFNVHTSVLVPGTESETPRGLLDIPVGATWFSRIKMGYHLTSPSGTNLIFGLRFNPFFPGSSNLQVARVSENQWFIEATTSHIAWAVSVGETRKDGGEVFEGNYLMPFRIVVTR